MCENKIIARNYLVSLVVKPRELCTLIIMVIYIYAICTLMICIKTM